MNSDIDILGLIPCDVLLYHGASTLSQLIQWFDGSEYSHASIYDGDMVLEAIPDGLRRRTLKASLSDTLNVDVWRLRKAGNFIGSQELPSGPVLDVIGKYAGEGDRFASMDEELLALLCTSRRLPLPFMRWALDSAASLLVDMVDGGKEPMLSSELVYRCFSEAGKEYCPRITGVDIRAKIETLHAPGQPKRTMKEADRVVAAFLDRYAASKHLDSRDDLLMAALEADPDFVTPKDLKKSPDFEKIGRLVLP